MTDTELLECRIQLAENNLRNAECLLRNIICTLHKAQRNYMEHVKFLSDLKERHEISQTADICVKDLQKWLNKD